VKTLTPNKATVARYMDAFRRIARAEILECLTDDVEWVLPGFYHTRGLKEFDGHITEPEFSGRPDIKVTRMVEEDDIVVAEGTVATMKADGTPVYLVFCDLFEMRDGKIRKLTSYLMETKG
jgi:ketosteroid isomerase-like protein